MKNYNESTDDFKIAKKPFLNIASAAIAYQEQEGISFSAMTEYVCNYCQKDYLHPHIFTPIFCKECTDTLKIEIKKMRGIT